MLNAVSGVVRGIAQTRSTRPESSTIGPSPATSRRLHRRAIGVARFLADALTATPRARQRAGAVVERRVRDAQIPDRAALRRRLYRRRFMLRLTTDRALPIAIALIVVIAAGASLAPGVAPVGAAEGAPAFARGNDRVRLSIGGNVPVDVDSVGTAGFAEAAAPVDDGTLYKPVAVDTTIQSSAWMLERYKVRDGDTLTGIASRFGVSMMTVWWANKLETKGSLKVGQTLVIPPVNGLIVTVETGDTLQSLARENKITTEEIVEVNELDDTNLIVGQVLVLPGARGEPLPTPKPTPAPVVPVGGGGGCGTCGGTVKYQGGAWAWPVVGGGNYISQYFTSGHLGLDIAADYGSTVVSPLAGQVIFGGWKSNGGGYQVWISHGNGIYTSLNHLSAVTASAGQNIGRGDRVGRVGMSGWASGSHLHIEVWIGAPWESGSYRVNPLRYY